jgi:hypothetical protein
MVVFMFFLAVYALTCTWFFVKLLRWTVNSERPCSCQGALNGGTIGILHGQKMCYPMAEALRV